MLKNFLDKNNKVYKLPKKYSKRIEVLDFFIDKFEKGRTYSEKEVNLILNSYHSFNDPCAIRRELFDNLYLGRSKDCKEYWRIK